MTAEIVDLGQYRKQKERGQDRAPQIRDDPPQQETRDSVALNQDDKTV
ncbi:MAG: hypothetical protein O3A85_01670 [Proteobacteria bacterium]|nr:hypothetical protein [Pseudomonadota bacterium]